MTNLSKPPKKNSRSASPFKQALPKKCVIIPSFFGLAPSPMKACRRFQRPWRSVARVVALHPQLHHLATQGPGAPIGGQVESTITKSRPFLTVTRCLFFGKSLPSKQQKDSFLYGMYIIYIYISFTYIWFSKIYGK